MTAAPEMCQLQRSADHPATLLNFDCKDPGLKRCGRTMTALSVNVNKIALLRNSRPLNYPEPAAAARICLEAGAAGVTVHPRPDQRHIRPADVIAIARLIGEEFPDREFNIEGNPFEPDFLELVQEARPAQCTLVPDAPGQATSDHGWNPETDSRRLSAVLEKLHENGTRSSLFMDANPKWIEAIAKLRPNRIELYTEPYARAAERPEAAAVCRQFAECAQLADGLGLGVNAGHDLSLSNLGPLLQAAPMICEVSIGHALIADAVFSGLADAVYRYLSVIRLAAKA